MLELASCRSKPSCDSGLQYIVLDDSGKKEGVWLTFTDRVPKVSLMFFGELSLVPTVGAFKVCEIDHVPVCLRDGVGRKPIMGYFSAAWRVRVADMHPETGAPLDRITMELNIIPIVFKTSYCMDFLGKETTISITAQIPQLCLIEDIAIDGAELVRPWGDRDYELCSPSASTKAFRAKSQERLKALKPKSDSAPDLREWRSLAKHIFG